jgi:D-aminopeptidase
VAAGYHSLNGNGEMTGVSWIDESGTCQGPIAITNTHAVGIAHAGIIAWMNQYHPDLTDVWLLPVAAETWDGYLNDINGHHVNEDNGDRGAGKRGHANQPDEGSVGGGTGMNCYQFKGGNGTASTAGRVPTSTTYTVGVFLQANFGRRARPDAQRRVPGGGTRRRQPDARLLQRPAGRRIGDRRRRHRRPALPQPVQVRSPEESPSAWPAPARSASHSSGDIFLAVSTANAGAFSPQETRRRQEPTRPRSLRRTSSSSRGTPSTRSTRPSSRPPKRSVANALIANEDMTGRDGHRSPALPRRRLAEILSRTREDPRQA